MRSSGITQSQSGGGVGGGAVTSVSATAPVTSSGGATPNIALPKADATHDGYLFQTDWTTFNNKVSPSRLINTTSPLSGGGDLSADRTLSITQSGVGTNGYLSSTDWNTFNNKQPAGSYIIALTGDVSATGPGSVAATVNSVGTSSAANVHSAELAANAATNLNTVSTIVKRDGSGNFNAGAISASSDLLRGSTSGIFTQQAANVTTDYSIKWPGAQGAASTALVNDGSGNLSWTLITTPPGGVTTNIQFNNAGAFGGSANFVFANGTSSVSLGTSNVITGNRAMAIGNGNTSSGDNSFTQGDSNIANVPYTSAMGNGCTASANQAHAHGRATFATAISAHAEGDGTGATSFAAHSEGDTTRATGSGSHAEGRSTNANVTGIASGNASHSEGLDTISSGPQSHSQNNTTIASGTNSTACGLGTTAQGFNQLTMGRYNVLQGTAGSFVSGDEAFIVGNGTADGARSNAFSVTNNAIIKFWGTTSGFIGHLASAATTSYNITWPSAQGAASTVLQNDGSGNLSWSIVPTYVTSTISSNTTVVSGHTYFCDTSAGAFTATLPSPVVNAYVILKDSTGSFLANNLTVNPGAAKIDTVSGNLTLNSNFTSITLVSNGTDWFIL